MRWRRKRTAGREGREGGPGPDREAMETGTRVLVPFFGATTNLDAESKRAAHFRSSWQQHVNVFGSWSRPECVQQLHQEAELNLQSLLQDFEEHLYEHKITGQTFKHPSSLSSEDTSLSEPSGAASQKPDFIFLPTPSQVCESRTSPVGIWPQDPAIGPPVAEKPRWHLGSQDPVRLKPVDTTGDGSLLPVDLIQGVCASEASHHRLLTPSPESQSPHLALRKTHSDFEHSLLHSPSTPPVTMEHAGLMCGSPSWNGPKGSTFSPSWNDSMDYMLAPSPTAKPPNSQHQADILLGPSQGMSGLSISSGSHSSSFTSISMEPPARVLVTTSTTVGRRAETEGATTSPGERDRRAMRPGALRFRERSLSTPTDSGSFCSTDNVCCAEPHHAGAEGYALMYPSGSSEDSASTDNVPLAVTDFFPDGRPRARSRSISLKKPKKKPPPPVRSVSLVKSLGGGSSPLSEGPVRENRPRSLFLPREHLQDTYLPDFLLGSRQLQEEPELPLSIGETATGSQVPDRELELSFPSHWQLNEWQSSDPYRSLSSSSTATGTTVIECLKARGSSESLDSPGTSRATSPSQFSVEAEAKISPFKPHGLMSPSSGYSSQSETPTPTIPATHVTGPSPLACKIRPKIPERKSSLPATSPMERPPRSRLSFELPLASASDFSYIKPKPKASRRHSDTSTATRPGQKTSSNQSALPMVTQTDLRNVRLRSIGRSEIDDGPEGSSDIIEEEQCRDDDSPPITPNAKPKPPVAMKPPLPKRPLNLMLESPSSSSLGPESPPISPKEWRMPVGNIYMVVRKPKPKKAPQATASTGPPPEVMLQQEAPDTQRGVSHSELPSPCTPEKDHMTGTLTSSITVSCLAELDRKRTKVPPPVPKKPTVLLLPSAAVHSNGAPETDLHSPDGEPPPEEGLSEENSQVQTEEIRARDPEVIPSSSETATGCPVEESAEESGGLPEIEALHISEEPGEGMFGLTSTPHTTEDLFTIIHRSKRKVLGRREPSATFGSRPSLVSPVRSDPRAYTLGATPRSSSRNQNFMALLQKKSSKPSPGGRVSAMELLKSTNPLARRVTEFSQPEPELMDSSRAPQGQ
ncbi:Nance-Horan syndrome protein isoform X2 [Scleropages formosus]|uniref:NHS like 2 n=1 Tax=Scleropages formosus TaxID=113540 RepID=A0A8C9RIE7_SCLFO|nr:NHS-like protein 2 isoform X2 [Scleropages formosus]